MEDDELSKIRRKKIEELMKRMIKPIKVDDDNFDEVIGEYENVVVDFWAEWCGPCRMLAPIIDELAKEYAGKVVFAKLNVDEARGIAIDYGISAIPTLIFFKRGKPVDAMVGAFPKSEIKRWIDRVLSTY
jgi:thioredoxin 1